MSPILFVGLGNPGSSYERNRHNIGFMAVDVCASLWEAPAFSLKKGAYVSEIQKGSQKIIFVKPQSYMNLSGKPVYDLAHFYKIPSERIWVFQDDLDLQFLQVRLKKGGGHGGHNGIRSLEDYLGKEFWRIRLGIGRPERGGEVSQFVLSNFSCEEQEKVDTLLQTLGRHLSLLIEEPIGSQGNQFLSKISLSKEGTQKNGL